MLGVTEEALIRTTMQGSFRTHGTWADRRIAIRCLAWCNKDYEIAEDELFLKEMSGNMELLTKQ